MKKSILSFVAAAAITGAAGANVQAEEVKVKEGDTLWGYSQQYNVPIDIIKEWNGLSSDVIHPEDVLEVYPEKKYIVSKGDTLWQISRQHNVTVEAIKEWNNLKSDLISPGQVFTLYPNAKAVKAVPVTLAETAVPKASNKNAAEKPAKLAAEVKSASETAKPAEPVKEEKADTILTMEATAYTATCEGCSGITATGINLKENPNQKVISVDPNIIPLGTKVYVEGYGKAIAGDTGGAIKGNKIDVFIPSKEDAIKYGRKTVKVTILD